ncbi:MAG: hypothetical protein V9H25_08165 [Candidatus Competibacter sp.]
MRIPKLTVLAEAGAVRAAEAMPDAGGWAVWIVYAGRGGERREPLERQRGGAARVRHARRRGPVSGGGGRRPFSGQHGQAAVRRGLCLALLWPALAGAWEEEAALSFIVAHSPLLQAQRAVVSAHRPPGLGRQVLEHTSVFVRAASGTSSTVSDTGDTTTAEPVTVGIQLNIPLSSPKERREYAQQALAEATKIDEVRGRALTDLAKLRELEAERAATRERLSFHKSKADWVQDRIKKGYEGDVEKLWETAQRQNAEAASAQAAGLAARRPAPAGGTPRGRAVAGAVRLPERETRGIAGGLSAPRRPVFSKTVRLSLSRVFRVESKPAAAGGGLTHSRLATRKPEAFRRQGRAQRAA